MRVFVRVFLHEFLFAWTLSCTSSCLRVFVRVFLYEFLFSFLRVFFFSFINSQPSKLSDLSDDARELVMQGSYSSSINSTNILKSNGAGGLIATISETTGCSLNIVFFFQDCQIYSGLWPLSVSHSLSVCVHNGMSNTSAAAELAEFRKITTF